MVERIKGGYATNARIDVPKTTSITTRKRTAVSAWRTGQGTKRMGQTQEVLFRGRFDSKGVVDTRECEEGVPNSSGEERGNRHSRR